MELGQKEEEAKKSQGKKNMLVASTLSFGRMQDIQGVSESSKNHSKGKGLAQVNTDSQVL